MPICLVGFCPSASPSLQRGIRVSLQSHRDLRSRSHFAGTSLRPAAPTRRKISAVWKATLPSPNEQRHPIQEKAEIVKTSIGRRWRRRMMGIAAACMMFLVVMIRGVQAIGLRTEMKPMALQEKFEGLPPATLVVSKKVKVQKIEGLPLNMLGIDMDKIVGEKQLKSKSWTKMTEAQEELMELEEDRIQFQWLQNVHMFAGALYSLIGLVVLYKAGSTWEKWMKEQEEKEIEKEIRLTGTFIDPRANRIPEEEEGLSQKEKDKWDKKKDEEGGGATGLKGKGGGPGTPPDSPKSDGEGPSQDTGYNTLDKLLGNN